MEVQIPLKKLVGNLATNAGGMIEIKLLGALNVIGEDIVIAVSPHGSYFITLDVRWYFCFNFYNLVIMLLL